MSFYVKASKISYTPGLNYYLFKLLFIKCTQFLFYFYYLTSAMNSIVVADVIVTYTYTHTNLQQCMNIYMKRLVPSEDAFVLMY